MRPVSNVFISTCKSFINFPFSFEWPCDLFHYKNYILRIYCSLYFLKTWLCKSKNVCVHVSVSWRCSVEVCNVWCVGWAPCPPSKASIQISHQASFSFCLCMSFICSPLPSAGPILLFVRILWVLCAHTLSHTDFRHTHTVSNTIFTLSGIRQGVHLKTQTFTSASHSDQIALALCVKGPVCFCLQPVN